MRCWNKIRDIKLGFRLSAIGFRLNLNVSKFLNYVSLQSWPLQGHIYCNGLLRGLNFLNTKKQTYENSFCSRVFA